MTEEERKQGIRLLREAVLTNPPWAGFRCTLLMTEFEAEVVLLRMEKFFARAAASDADPRDETPPYLGYPGDIYPPQREKDKCPLCQSPLEHCVAGEYCTNTSCRYAY